MSASMTKPPLDFSVIEPSFAVLDVPAETDSGPAGPLREALPSLLAFCSLQPRSNVVPADSQQVVDPRITAAQATLQLLQDEVLDLVAKRALALTGADGVAIAIAEGDQIICRASAGTVAPDPGSRLEPSSGISGTCFRTGEVVRCDSVEGDDRVNLQACLRLGARSMLAVPLPGRYKTIGLIEAFSTDDFSFNEVDVRTLQFFAEVILGALRLEVDAVPASPATGALNSLEALSGSHTAGLIDPAKKAKPAAQSPLPKLQNTVAPAENQQHAAKQSASPASAAPPLKAPAPVLLRLPDPAPSSAKVVDSDNRLFSSSSESIARPGLSVVIVLLLVATILGAGLWWQMHSRAITKPAISTAANLIDGSPVPSLAASAADNPSVDTSSANDLPSETASRSGPLPEVTSIRHWTSGHISNVVVDLQDQVPYEAHRLSGPDRIYFDLHDAGLNNSLAGKVIAVGDPALSRIRAAQLSAGVVRVVLDTTANSAFSVSLEHDPYRLLVQIRDANAPPADGDRVALFPATPETSARKLAALPATPQGDQARLQARLPKLKVVLDAGHGGWDLGTVGRKGLLEKDLVLDITQRLGKLLQNRMGSDVLYTRDSDFYISLDQRAASANTAQADLFVSIHANYSDMPSARGVETYYAQSFSPPGPQELEGKSPASTVHPALTLTSTELKGKVQASRRLAAAVQQSMYTTLADDTSAIRNRGVKEASYVVLTGTEMPAILAEVSFVSSPADETNLQSEEYRQRIAEALYRGIAHYAVSSPRVKLAKAAVSGAAQ
jgi:N-acetylmuramoyl-L-alanine amidase